MQRCHHSSVAILLLLCKKKPVKVMSSPLILTIFTLNCWGIPWVSKDRAIRMDAIATQLSSGKYDIVCLQEVWSNDDFDFIKEKVKENLPFAHYFHSGVIGSGVCILSKFPIREALFHQWSVNGYVHKVQHGDWFGGKGVGLCKLDVHGQPVNVYTAHLHAEYDRDNDEYLAHRVVQAFDTAQFVKLTSGAGDLTLVGGDLNTEPGDLAFRIIRRVAGLQDAHDLRQKSEGDCSGTNECARNSYSDQSCVKTSPHGKRIDYLLFRPPVGSEVTVQHFGFPLPPLVPGRDFSFSDHEALAATLRLSKDESQAVKEVSSDSELEDALMEGVDVCDHALAFLRDQRLSYTVHAVVTLIILVLTHYLLPYVLPKEVGQILPILSPVLHVVCVLYLLFAIFMATLWNCMEVNGILAGRIGMLISLNKN